MKKISQREARRLRKRVDELETQRRAERLSWGRSHPAGSIHLGSLHLAQDTRFYGKLEATQMYGRVIVAKVESSQIHLYGAP